MQFKTAGAVERERTEYLSEWYQKNKERIRIRNRARYIAKKDEILRKTREWMAKNPDKVRAQARKYRANNLELCRRRSRESNRRHKDKIREYSKAYRKRMYPEMREIILARNREWAKRNSEKRKTYNKAYRMEHAERLREANKKWRKENKDHIRLKRQENKHKDREQASRKRALKRGSKINLNKIVQWMKTIKLKPMTTCYWCEKRTPTTKIHFDHIVPLSKGGPHCVENLCVACEQCNLSKSNKLVRVWTKIGQQFMEL